MTVEEAMLLVDAGSYANMDKVLGITPGYSYMWSKAKRTKGRLPEEYHKPVVAITLNRISNLKRNAR